MRALLAPALLVLACVARAAAPVAVEGAWARPTVPGQDSGGAYMTLTAREPLTLLGARTPAAGIVEMHEMKMEGDIMRMRAAETLPLAPGQPLKLAPGGFHFMLMDLKGTLRAGTRFPMTLRFRDARGKVQTLEVSVPVSVSPPAGDRR